MIKIPFLNRFITDDQEFYDAQINEELKYCNSDNLVITFTDIGKSKRAFIIRTLTQNIMLMFMKSDYKSINEALEKIRLNLALAEKENSLDSSANANIILDTSSKHKITIKGNEDKKSTIIISSVKQLLLNNNPLKEKEEIIKRLFELSTQKDKEEPYLDFYKAGYDAGIQNYLIMNLYKDNIDLNDKIVTALSFYKMKEPKIYHLVNSLLRGNFDEMYSYLDNLENKISITSIIIICQNIIQAEEILPIRNFDLMIYRMGLGVNKNKTVGSQNSYESFVSFGTSGGRLSEIPLEETKPIIYKRILKKNEKAIPVDLIENLGLIYLEGTQENEILLPPFTFQITDIKQEESYDIYDIEETSKIDSRELLNKRLDELEQYLKNKNDMEKYDKLRQFRDRTTKKLKRTIRGYNIKDIYYGLRPKKKKKKKIKEESFER